MFNSTGNGNTDISLAGATQPINSLFFTGGAAEYTIGQLSGDALDFDDGGGILADSSVTNAQTIMADSLTNGSGLLVENDASNGGEGAGNGLVGLTMGNVTIRDGGTLSVVTTSNTSTTAFNGDITESSGQTAGVYFVSPAGAAASTNVNYIINGNNTYTGGTTIQVNTGNNGSIQIGSDSPFGSGKVTTLLVGSSAQLEAIGGTHTISNAIDLNGGLNFVGDNTLVLDGPIAISSNPTRTFNNKMTSGGAMLMFGATPGSSDIYLGDPVSNGGDGVGRVLVLQAQNGATTIINANFRDVDSASAVRYSSAIGGNIIINNLQTYTGETQLGSGSATVQFHDDYNAGDSSGPFGLGTLVANGSANIELAPTGGDRTIANPFRLEFGFTVNNISGDNSSVTFSGPIKFNGNGAGRLIQNRMDPTTGGILTLGSAASPNTFTLSDTPNLAITFYDHGRTVINDTIEDALDTMSNRIPNNIIVNSNTSTTTFNGDQNTDGDFTVNGTTSPHPIAIINGNRSGSGAMTTSGILVVNGSKTGAGLVTVNDTGTLAGTGSIEGDVTNNGTIAPGDESLTPGTLTLTDSVTNGTDSHWLIGLDGASSGKLAVGGNVDLSAVDNLDVIGVGSGTSWIIGTYVGMLTGTFDNITAGYAVDYGTGTNSQITLNVAPIGPDGDFNSDGVVDAADYVAWRKNDGSNNALPNDGGLGTPIGQAHYDLWRANFGNSGSGSGALNAVTAVPEPSSLLLLLLAMAGLAAPALAGNPRHSIRDRNLNKRLVRATESKMATVFFD